ncbi:MAG: D-glycero-beta-D-manno-heptose-7-phosphate kinase [Alphaproteobacteria bacterium]
MAEHVQDLTLQSVLENIKKSSVLVVGDIMLDRFVYGSVERISPESPVPVLSVKREERMLGGAGNALANLAGLGAQGRIVALIGDDDEGAQLRTQISALGYSADSLITENSRPTTVKTRFLAGHQQLLRTDFENKNAISDDTATRIVDTVKTALDDVQAVILSDYGKGLLRPDVIAGIIDAAAAKNIPVIVDPKGQDFSIYRGAAAVTPNKKELSEAARGAAVSSDDEVIHAARGLIEECGIGAVIATRSGEGISVIEHGAVPVHLRTTDIEVFDVSGAGDTVIATVAAAVAAGGTLVQAASLANIAGSIVVTKVGTAAVRHSELVRALDSDQGDALTQTGKDRDKAERARRGDIFEYSDTGWAEAAELVRRWKARGLKVGFTNGCFDILHYGHVSYLNNARDHCDRLVMGLNGDASIKILKGAERPVHDEQSRAAVLAALGAIDMVVMFGARQEGDDNTAIALLEALKPDVYFKGGDYTEDQIPEAPTVRAYGGEVNVMPVYEGHSTTNSIAKMKTGEAA